jgi:hypothetical protein
MLFDLQTGVLPDAAGSEQLRVELQSGRLVQEHRPHDRYLDRSPNHDIAVALQVDSVPTREDLHHLCTNGCYVAQRCQLEGRNVPHEDCTEVMSHTVAAVPAPHPEFGERARKDGLLVRVDRFSAAGLPRVAVRRRRRGRRGARGGTSRRGSLDWRTPDRPGRAGSWGLSRGHRTGRASRSRARGG